MSRSNYMPTTAPFHRMGRGQAKLSAAAMHCRAGLQAAGLACAKGCGHSPISDPLAQPLEQSCPHTSGSGFWEEKLGRG